MGKTILGRRKKKCNGMKAWNTFLCLRNGEETDMFGLVFPKGSSVKWSPMAKKKKKKKSKTKLKKCWVKILITGSCFFELWGNSCTTLTYFKIKAKKNQTNKSKCIYSSLKTVESSLGSQYLKGKPPKGKKVNSSEPYPNPLLCPSGVLANSQFEHRIQGESSGLEPVAVLLDWRNKNRS